MAREIPYIAAVNEAIQQEMARDDTVVFYGQDVAPSDEDPLVQAFGRDRVRVSRRSPRPPRSAWPSAWRWPATARSWNC